MFFRELFASMLHRRGSPNPHPDEQGEMLSRRLHELLSPIEAKQVKAFSEETTRKKNLAASRSH